MMQRDNQQKPEGYELKMIKTVILTEKVFVSKRYCSRIKRN